MADQEYDIADLNVVPGRTQMGDMAFHSTQSRIFSNVSDEAASDEDEEIFDEDEDEGAAGDEEPGEEETEDEGEDEEPGEPVSDELGDDNLDRVVTLKDGNRVSVRELVSGYWRMKDYTQTKQEMREQQRQFQTQADTILSQLNSFNEKNQVLAGVGRLLEANPWLAQALDKLWDGDLDSVVQLSQSSQRILPQAPPQQAPQQPQQQGFQQDDTMLFLLNERWQRELAEVKSEYPGVDEQVLFDALPYHTDEQGVPSIKETFKAVYFDKAREQSKEQGRKKAVREQKKGAKVPTNMRSGGTPGKGGGKPTGTPAQRAMQQYRQSLSE